MMGKNLFKQSINPPIAELRHLPIVPPQLLHPISYNFRTPLQRLVKFFRDCIPSACVNDQYGFVLQNLLEIFFEHWAPRQQSKGVLIYIAGGSLATRQKIYNA